MHRLLRGLTLGALLLAGPLQAAPLKAPAPVASVRGDAVAGAAKAEAERCQECHGVDGHGADEGAGPGARFPKLAGQSADYLIKQFRNFRSGERRHDVMNMMAASVDDRDALDIVAYFASRKPMSGDGRGANPLAAGLFLNGDPARGIAACVSCHGPQGKGTANVAPAIGGQAWLYLEKQLLEWRSGERGNSSVMKQLAAGLTDAEIRALTDYLSGLE